MNEMKYTYLSVLASVGLAALFLLAPTDSALAAVPSGGAVAEFGQKFFLGGGDHEMESFL